LGIALLGVDEITKLQRILDEENGGIVADHVPVAFLGVELEGESAGITLGVSGTLFSAHGGEAQEGWSVLADLREELGRGVFGHVRVVADEMTVRAGTFGVDDALGDALTIEVGHFLEQKEIFEHNRAARAHGQRVLVVADRASSVGGHLFLVFRHNFSFLVLDDGLVLVICWIPACS
jgi:hypothetical protein